MGPILVFDVGGTNIRAALYDHINGSLINIRCIDTINYFRYNFSLEFSIEEVLFNLIYDLGMKTLENKRPELISMAFPGPINSDGSVMRASTIFGEQIINLNIKNKLTSLWPDSKIFVINDVTASGYRYLDMGHKNFCIVTVSSGIGSKIFINSSPFDK